MGAVFFLSTLQKMTPLVLLSYVAGISGSFVFYSGVVLSVSTGVVGSLNEVSLRKLLAYSSIHHAGWMLLPLLEGDRVWVLYFLSYSFISGLIISYLNSLGLYNVLQMCSVSNLSLSSLSLMVGFMSLGGMPPLLGFLPKYLLLQTSNPFSVYPCLGFLVMTSIFMLFIYARLGISVLFISGFKETSSQVFPFSSIAGFGLGVNLVGFLMGSPLVFSFLQ